MLIDFNKAEIAKSVFYGGDAGAKDAIIHDGEFTRKWDSGSSLGLRGSKMEKQLVPFHDLNPFTFIARGENADCNAAALRFVNSVNMDSIANIIENIPESAGNLSVMPEKQKAFYLELMRIRLNQALIPACLSKSGCV